MAPGIMRERGGGGARRRSFAGNIHCYGLQLRRDGGALASPPLSRNGAHGCSGCACDGIDLRRLAADEMRSWFMNLLDTAPRELLDPDDISDVAPVPERLADGRLAITLPESCRRVVGVRLAGWERSATILTDRESAAARRQCSPMSRAGSHCPVAVVDGRRLIMSPSEPPEVEQLLVCLAPAEGTRGVYRLDPRALSTIPQIND